MERGIQVEISGKLLEKLQALHKKMVRSDEHLHCAGMTIHRFIREVVIAPATMQLISEVGDG